MKRFCIDVGIILVAFFEVFFGTFPTSRKMLHPTKMLHIAVKSWFGRLQNRANFDTKSDQKLDRNLHRNFNDLLKVLGVIFGGFWKHFGVQKPLQIQAKFWSVFFWFSPARRGRDAASALLRRCFDASAAGVFSPRMPPGGALFRAKKG